MESPAAYIPIDRRLALAQGKDLPNQSYGAALFADISGFTPLTEVLLKDLGPQRGPEELTRQLNLVYNALVAEVHRFGGSVLTFSGDAITCWLDGDNGAHATACALEMQKQMTQFSVIKTPSGNTVSLAMKAAVAVGPVNRFQIGDAAIQLIDALAGITLDRMTAAEHQAERGEVVIAPEVVDQIGHLIEITEWRTDHDLNERFAVVAQFKPDVPISPQPWPELAENLSEAQLSAWLLPPVYERLRQGQGQFLTELRPTVALFLKFGGIDYDQDPQAGQKLDAYVQSVQRILARYESYLLQLTIGDKGSYLYASFGAPIAHQDDVNRALAAALELQSPPPELNFICEIQIGISQGRMLTGAYGGTARRTYGILGDDVNLAARLMQAAQPGQILVSQIVQQTATAIFDWQSLPAMMVKGKTEPISVFSLNGRLEQNITHPFEPEYAFPMVGRTEELALITEKMAQVIEGHGQTLGITGEAGMGKSRLVAEVIRLTGSHEFVTYVGECQSYGTNTSYLVWQAIWRRFFGINLTWPLEEQIWVLEQQLVSIDPGLVPRLPLLGAILNLPIPDNDLTRSFDAKLRKTSLESLLLACVQERAATSPIFIVLEDSQWIDALSRDLLDVISRAAADLPVLVVLSYRNLAIERSHTQQLQQLPNFTNIHLTHFTPAETEQLIHYKLRQFSKDDQTISFELVKRITDRAEGNPFYVEELLNYLHDRGINPHDNKALGQLDLPNSLHSLILSRVDQLSENQKITLKVASVIGRLFRAAMLWGVYPQLGDQEHVEADLKALDDLEITALESPDPELTYLFRHIVTQEVAYESLPYATRAFLHDQIGQYIENTYNDKLEQYLNLLAYHYSLSENEPKKRTYLQQAGEAAQANYANEAAIDYYRRVLTLLPDDEKIGIMLKLGEVLQRVGNWSEADSIQRQALDIAEKLEQPEAEAWSQTAIGELLRKQGSYADAEFWLQKALSNFAILGNEEGMGQILHYAGTLAAQQGNYDAARVRYEESLAIRRKLDDKSNIGSLLSNLGIIARYQGNYETAQMLHEEGLRIRQDLGDKYAIANSLNNLGYLALDQGDYIAARSNLEQAVSLQREIGDQWALANALNNLGNVARDQNDYETAQNLYEQSLATNQALGDRWAIVYLLEDIGGLAAMREEAERALHLYGAASALREEIGAPLPPAEQEKVDALFKPAKQALGEQATAEAIDQGKLMPLETALAYAAHRGEAVI